MKVSIYNPPCYYLFTFAGSPCWALELLLFIRAGATTSNSFEKKGETSQTFQMDDQIFKEEKN
jgi:hypothetical protein